MIYLAQVFFSGKEFRNCTGELRKGSQRENRPTVGANVMHIQSFVFLSPCLPSGPNCRLAGGEAMHDPLYSVRSTSEPRKNDRSSQIRHCRLLESTA